MNSKELIDFLKDPRMCAVYAALNILGATQSIFLAMAAMIALWAIITAIENLGKRTTEDAEAVTEISEDRRAYENNMARRFDPDPKQTPDPKSAPRHDGGGGGGG